MPAGLSWAPGVLKVSACPPGSSHASVPALHPVSPPTHCRAELSHSATSLSCSENKHQPGSAEIRAVLAGPREQSPPQLNLRLQHHGSCLPPSLTGGMRAWQMG